MLYYGKFPFNLGSRVVHIIKLGIQVKISKSRTADLNRTGQRAVTDGKNCVEASLVFIFAQFWLNDNS